MNDSKNRDLAISATSKIFEKVTNSFNAEDTDKRWFWELLQNAKDTVVYKSNETAPFNVPNKKVDVKLVFSKNSENETILKFEHNGNPFKFSNHPYKYDDPKCLLLADSGKIEEDESQREDVTGQFGTGFLSTHILSLRILVEGIFFDRTGKFSKFDFELDRRELQNKLKLAESVEKSLNQYDNNFTPITNITEFQTSFTYFLTDNKVSLEEGFETVRKGINGLENFIPFVLSFSKEIRSVEIFDELISQNHTIFRRTEELEKNDKEENIIEIDKKVFALNNGVGETIKEEETIYISTISDKENHIDLGNRIYKNDTGFEFREIDRALPVLFCTFPLIGSENWRFPLMFNCSKFYPKTERDGITLLKDKDNGNWNRVENAIEIYKKFCRLSIQKGYSQLLFLADTRVGNCPTWCNEEIYNGYLNEIRNFLLSLPVVINEFGNPINLENALFPTSKGEDNLKAYWDVCFQYYPTKIPQYNDIETWNKLMSVNYYAWENLKFPLKRLLSEIQEFETLQKFADTKFDSDISKSIEWLNKVYQIIIDRKKTDYFKEYKIIPTISGIFKSFSDSDLFIENESKIPDEFIEIFKTMTQKDWNDILIHRDLIEIDKNRTPKTVKDISVEINKILNYEEKNIYGQVQKSFFDKENAEFILMEILKFSPTLHENTFQTKLFNSAKLFLRSGLQAIDIRNISDFDFSPAKRQLIKLLNTKIEKANELSELSVENSEQWLLTYLLLLQENSEFKHLLEFGNIVPNRKGLLMPHKDICAYGKEKPLDDDLIDILFDLNENENWNECLIHDDFRSILLKESKTMEELASKIQEELEKLRVDNSYSSKSNAILNLIKWCSNPINEDMQGYFRAFMTEKDKIFVNISLEDKDAGDNIVKLLKHKEKLSDLVEIAEMSAIIGIDKIKNLAQKEIEEKQDFEFKIHIGKQIEIAFIETFKLLNNSYDIIYQGIGDKDVIVRNPTNGKEFYIELKSFSPNNYDKKLRLSISQAKKAVEQAIEGNYVVSVLVRPNNWETATVEYIKKGLNSQLNIGNSLVKVVEREKSFEDLINSNEEIDLEFEDSRRKIIVSEEFWRRNGNSFNALIEKIKNYLG